MAGSTSSHRVQKMNRLVRSEIARLLLSEVSDPRLKNLAITEVELTRDLRQARVFYEGSTSDPKEVKRGLARAAPFFRRRLGQNLELRHVPELLFECDTHTAEVTHLFSVMEEIHQRDKHE